ncbi:MAG: 50S ribosomal protein L13 [Phycisphaerales bacterium]|nr:MAG: 50S ribosomal protein L13 [Phycisphaerales bacterium]
MRQTTFITNRDQLTGRPWHIVDADGKRLGRMASEISQVLMGKHRPEYTAHVDTGDYVVVINAAKVVMTGKKMDHRYRTFYSGYPGGLRVETYRERMEKNPASVVEQAVKRMLPKGILGKQMLKKLKVYNDTEHPHHAQQPTPLEV